MGAELTLGQADGLDESVYGVELKRGEVETCTDLLYQALVLGCAGGRVLVEVLAVVSLELLDDAAGEQFQVALR